MPAQDYPFIEIAVHPAIRERYAEGAGLAVLSPSVDYVHWANGAAAAQFGYDSIYAFLEDEAFAEGVLARQIATAAGRVSGSRQPEKLVLRIGAGFRRVATTCTLEPLTLGDGEPALLLALPPEKRLKDSVHRANAMIAGFGDNDTHVAVLDGEANDLARSLSFDALRIDPKELLALVEAVEREPGRLVKRPLATARGTLPAAVARIGDGLGLNLIFVVEPDIPAAPVVEAADGAAALEPAATAPSQPAAAATVLPQIDDGFRFDRSARPVRFVWKIDAAGRFSEISPEFGKAVGPNAADVVGRTFEDVATVFNLDPDGLIGELLRRRDTWSGKTVRWPVQGTPLAVPVDLAALPTYSRERAFDGFRGFGIIRIGDAEEDPERLGLALVPQAPVAAPTAAPAIAQDADAAEPAEAGPATRIPAPSNDDAAPAATPKLPAAPDVSESGQRPEDPFRGEVPALRIVETPARRSTDKVIDLEEHRSRGREGLSKMDQAVFHQIGEELGRRLANRDEPRRPAEEPGPPAQGSAGAAATAQEVTASPPAGGDAVSPPPAEHVAAVALSRPELPAEELARPAEEQAPAASPIVPAAEHVDAVCLAMPEKSAAPEPAAEAPRVSDNLAALLDPGLQRRQQRSLLTASLIDALPVPLLVLRGDRLLHANEEWLTLTGYGDLAAMEAAGGLDAIIVDTHRPIAPSADQATGGDALMLQRADGAPLPVRARLQSIGWGEGSALLLALARHDEPAGTASPADEDRRQAAEIEADELRSILETATDGVVILDEDGTIRSMNRSAHALFDYESEETEHQPFAMLFAHESQRAVLDYVAGLSGNGVASVLNDGREVIGREASGGFIPLFMTIGRLRGSNGYCAVMRDITHWKRTEEELRNARRSAETANAHKSEFLARVSHEIRTPLNAIIGFAEMMATERFGPIGSPRYLEYAHDIGRSGRHVLDIVNDLLDISKIEAGAQEMDFSAVSLNELLAEAVSLLQPQANGERVIIRTSLSTALPDIVADPRSIKQIAINLLANAVRFTPPGGQIVVSTVYEPNGRAVMRVRDTGVGMSRTELDHAMKPFRQGPTSPMRPRGDGTGLGLPLTKAMVEANRAQFTIESAPGEGTLVQVTFPPQRVLAD